MTRSFSNSARTHAHPSDTLTECRKRTGWFANQGDVLTNRGVTHVRPVGQCARVGDAAATVRQVIIGAGPGVRVLVAVSACALLVAACGATTAVVQPSPSPVYTQDVSICVPSVPSGNDPTWSLKAVQVRCDYPHLFEIVSHVSASAPAAQLDSFCTPATVRTYVARPDVHQTLMLVFSATLDTRWLDGAPSVVCLTGVTRSDGSATPQTLTHALRGAVTNSNASTYMQCRDGTGNISLSCHSAASRYIGVAELELDGANPYPGDAALTSRANQDCPSAMAPNMKDPASSDWLYVKPTQAQWEKRQHAHQQAHIDCFIAQANWILHS